MTTPTIGGVAWPGPEHAPEDHVCLGEHVLRGRLLADLSANPIIGDRRTRRSAFNSELLSATVPVLLDLGGFIFVNGNVTITKGGPTSVDISTGLGNTNASLIPAGLKDATKVPVVTEDPTDGSLGTNADYSTLWNLKVSSLQFAFTAANAFVGNGFGWNPATDSDGILSKAEVGANAVGIFAGGISLVMVLLTPLGGMPLTQRFLTVKGQVGSLGLVGLDGVFTLDVDELEFDVNRGPTLATGAGMAVVDWVSSFPDPDSSDDPVDPYDEDPTPGRVPPLHRRTQPTGALSRCHQLGLRHLRHPRGDHDRKLRPHRGTVLSPAGQDGVRRRRDREPLGPSQDPAQQRAHRRLGH